jgi:hypothetical protein
MKTDEYLSISIEKQLEDLRTLAGKIEESEWVDPNTILVCCSPDYSSFDVQMLNHLLSRNNENQLYDVAFLEMPYPNMSQVFDIQDDEYKLYDRYLSDWARRNIHSGYKYIFHDSGVLRGSNFSKLRYVIKERLSQDKFKLSSLYVREDTIIKPHYYVSEFSKNKTLLFSWENPKNPNWN